MHISWCPSVFKGSLLTLCCGISSLASVIKPVSSPQMKCVFAVSLAKSGQNDRLMSAQFTNSGMAYDRDACAHTSHSQKTLPCPGPAPSRCRDPERVRECLDCSSPQPGLPPLPNPGDAWVLTWPGSVASDTLDEAMFPGSACSHFSSCLLSRLLHRLSFPNRIPSPGFFSALFSFSSALPKSLLSLGPICRGNNLNHLPCISDVTW